MSVRWKPMILLSALSVLLAAGGLLAISAALLPGGSDSILAQARAETKARQFDRALIQYQRALQLEPKNARIHEEMAAMLAERMRTEPAARAKFRAEWLHALNNAATYGPQRPGPPEALLKDALEHEDTPASRYWANKLIVLEPVNADANFVLAREALERQPADPVKAGKSIEVLQKAEPERARTLWLAALAARALNDDATLDTLLASMRQGKAASDPADQLARVALRALDLEQSEDPSKLAEKVQALRQEVKALGEAKREPAFGRDRRVGEALQKAESHLARVAARDAGAKAVVEPLATQVEELANQTFEQAIEASKGSDPRLSLAYAEHLMLRNRRAKCLEVVAQALKQPSASLPVFAETAAMLREVGVKTALADTSDPDRIARAEPMIKEMLGSSVPRNQAVGHLFQGIIDLERSGVSPETAGDVSKPEDASARAARAASALTHLKAASEGLKDVPAAQALYGVALILSKETDYGRQYLQEALRMGADRLDARYQLWAAWSVLQAGYPEEAEPIVSRLMGQVASGAQAGDLAATLHVLRGEIHQNRHSNEELRLARQEYQKALVLGVSNPAPLKLRMAQIDAQLGDAKSALDEINDTHAGPSAEQLAVLTLKSAGRLDLARTRLDAARQKYPESAELAGLDAAMLLDADQAAEAETRLSAFLKAHPENLELGMLRARVLASGLGKADEARALLDELAKQSDTSGPLVQRALLELSQRNFPAVETVIRQIRNRWKDAAAADLLDAQLAFARGNPKAAHSFLDAALKKDPSNKVALFWKAQLEDLTGSGADAQRIFEQLVQEHSSKELEAGLPLAVAAQWSLAARALDKREYDSAIAQFQALLKNPQARELQRAILWKLTSAYSDRGQAKEARHEVERLLSDPKVTSDERVRAADVLRKQGDEASANAQIDQVLKANPAHAGAVAYRSLMLADRNRAAEAVALIRKAIDTKQPEPPSIYLMLAALENLDGKPGHARALRAIDEGLAVYPDSADLLKARYTLMVEGQDPQPVAFVEEQAQARPQGPARALLVEVYAETGALSKAKEMLHGLLEETSEDSAAWGTMLARLATLTAMQAANLAQKGDKTGEALLRRELAGQIADGRKRFPDDLRFPRLECELAARAGDLARAKRLAQEMADAQPSSPVGLVMLGGLHNAEGKPAEAARAFEKALERNPSDNSVRLDLARVRLSMNQSEAAAEQAEAVLRTSPELSAAVVIKAKALATMAGSPETVSQSREKALALLLAVIQKEPRMVEAAHLASDIQVLQGRRDEAIRTLEAALKAEPRDDTGLSLLVQRLVEPGGTNPAAQVVRAKELAELYGGKDEVGLFCLALAVGLHKGDRPDLALPWAKKAASKIDRPVVHLTCGDILLAEGEATTEPASARERFQEALREYDLVLKAQPDSVEAINNKAWVLYRHFNRNDEALELAEGLSRTRPESELPAEFLDTLGSIQTAVGHADDAERTFRSGLEKAPEHPILNFHLGRLLSSDPHRAEEAKPYLKKAAQLRSALPRSMASEVEDLLARVGS